MFEGEIYMAAYFVWYREDKAELPQTDTPVIRIAHVKSVESDSEAAILANARKLSSTGSATITTIRRMTDEESRAFACRLVL